MRFIFSPFRLVPVQFFGLGVSRTGHGAKNTERNLENNGLRVEIGLILSFLQLALAGFSLAIAN
jgi:hypothetical protein